MLNIFRISEMVGMSHIELMEIDKHASSLTDYKKDFMEGLRLWKTEFEVSCGETPLLLDGYYEALISGEYGETFYVMQYHQALHWIDCELSQSRVMLVLSQFRKLFIRFAELLKSHNLAKGLCHVLDIAQSIVSVVFAVVESIERMKLRSESEIRRIQKSYQLISAEIPPAILKAYLDHQRWKLVAFNLALGRPLDWEGFEISHQKCRLANWLEQGGLELISKEKQAIFFEAHERVHHFGEMAITQSKGHHPERILQFLADMEGASDIVAQVLLDVIESEFIRIATADGLTNLPNRRSFDMDFHQNMAFAKRHDFWVGLILIDIDLFKSINDSFGHLVGDFVLKEIASLLQKTVREEEKVYRWGGEEFAILTLCTNPDALPSLAERVRLTIENSTFVYHEKNQLQLTVSSGSVSFKANTHRPQHEIFALCDKQLYQAKHSGRNQIKHLTISDQGIK